MILSHLDIVEKVRLGEIVIKDPSGEEIIKRKTGEVRDEEQLQSHGFDLKIEAVYRWGRDKWEIVGKDDTVKIAPGEFLAIRTFEHIQLDMNIAATVHTIARKSLLGLSPISTTVHAGWAKQEAPQPLLVAVHNVSKKTLRLKQREGFCRLIFHEVKTEATKQAPRLDEVGEDFEVAKGLLAKAYGIRRRVLGMLLIALLILFVIGLLFLIQEYAPERLIIGLSVVLPLLTIGVNYLRKRFNVL
jgi:deoxycytidine triphosphate deaminase